MKLLAKIIKALIPKPKFNGTPEMFLAMAMKFAAANGTGDNKVEIYKWGLTLQKVMRVNLKPYKDFEDLLIYGTPDFSITDKIDQLTAEHQQRVDLKKAIYGNDVDLGEDDALKSNSDQAIQTRMMMTNLSKYVNFKPEDQKIIDDFIK